MTNLQVFLSLYSTLYSTGSACISFSFFKFTYLFERERVCVHLSRGGAEREGERESQQVLRYQPEPSAGVGPVNSEIKSQTLN